MFQVGKISILVNAASKSIIIVAAVNGQHYVSPTKTSL